MIELCNGKYQHPASDGFTLECSHFIGKAGEITCIVGPNGGGKSTLLSILGSRLKPMSGCVTYRGLSIETYSQHVLAREIGWIDPGAFSCLVSELLVIDHLSLGLIAARENVPFFHRKLEIDNLHSRTRMPKSLAEEMGQVSTKRIADLNAGARQSLAIALTIIGFRHVILADEGTATLDIKNARLFFESMRSLAQKHSVAVVAVTHDIILASKFGDRAYFVWGGEVRCLWEDSSCSPAQRIREIENSFVPNQVTMA